MITRSMSETGALAFKAARGAGLEWGMAEEARFAVLWLEARGLSGIKSLAQGIEKYGNQGEVCGLHAGISIADAGVLPLDGLQISGVVTPLFLLPFVAQLNAPIVLRWKQTIAYVAQGHVWMEAGVHSDASVTVSIRHCDFTPEERPFQNRATCQLSDWHVLEESAAKTYAPATAASRALGAGGADD